MSAPGQPQLMTGDDPSVASSLPAPQWGVFKDGQAVVVAEGVKVFEYKKEADLPTFVIEKGAFRNYNKVDLPYAVSIVLQTGTNVAKRKALIDSADAVLLSLDLYDLVSPEKTYSSMNAKHVDYHRSRDGGLGVIAVEIWFQEIRIGTTQTFTDTQNPSGSQTQSNGQTQTTPPTQQQTNGLEDNFAGDGLNGGH